MSTENEDAPTLLQDAERGAMARNHMDIVTVISGLREYREAVERFIGEFRSNPYPETVPWLVEELAIACQRAENRSEP